MSNKVFKLRDSDRLIRDVIDEFFEGQNANYDMRDLMKANLLGNEETGPAGEMMPDEEMV